MIKAVIFDVDGVLLDTVPYHFQAWKKLFESQGKSFSMNDYLLRVNGVPRHVGIKNILTKASDEELNMLALQKQTYFLELVTQNPPQPLDGIIMLLRKLKTKKYILAAASSSKNAPMLLKKAKLARFFSTVVGGNDFKLPKPHPDLFLTASNRLNIAPYHCIVIEDATIGIQAGKNAGMKTIGVLSSGDKKIKAQATYYISSMRDYEKALQFIESV